MIFSDSITTILHPMTVHFPIALIITAAALALLYVLRRGNPFVTRTVRVITVLAALVAWMAVITGGFTPNFTGNINTVEDIHHLLAIVTSITISIAATFYLLFGLHRIKRIKWIGWCAFSFLLLSAIAVAATGYYGGYIVYNLLL